MSNFSRFDICEFRDGGVYIIRIDSLSKIGCSMDPHARIKKIPLPKRPEVLLVVMTPKWKQLEEALHRRFAHLRRHGEWFALDDQSLEDAQRIALAWSRMLIEQPTPEKDPARILQLVNGIPARA